MRLTQRWAASFEGPMLGDFISKAATYDKLERPLSLDWSKCAGWRLTIQEGVGLIGLVHLLCSPPMAYIENVILDPGLSSTERKRVLAIGIRDALDCAKDAGCSAIAMNLDPDDEVWIKHWLRRGAQVLPPRPTIVLEL